MDLKSLRTPTFTALELAAARASTQARKPSAVQAAPRPVKAAEPVARTELWRQFHAGAVRDGHPNPEKFADSAVRSREIALKQRSKRHHTVVLQDAPKPPNETASAAKGKSAAKAPGARCRALTLEGRPCGFAATCGSFCKKHAPKEPSFLKADPRRFDSSSLKGHLCIPRRRVTALLGASHCPPNEKVDIEWFLQIDGVLVSLYYYKDDPQLHVGGHTVEAVAKARSLFMD